MPAALHRNLQGRARSGAVQQRAAGKTAAVIGAWRTLKPRFSAPSIASSEGRAFRASLPVPDEKLVGSARVHAGHKTDASLRTDDDAVDSKRPPRALLYGRGTRPYLNVSDRGTERLRGRSLRIGPQDFRAVAVWSSFRTYPRCVGVRPAALRAVREAIDGRHDIYACLTV